MAKRIVNTDLVVNGVRARMEIVDLVANGSDLDLTIEIAAPGPDISYRGDVDNLTDPIMGSAMSFTAYLGEYERDQIMGKLYSSREYLLACALFLYDENENEHFEWAGVIMPDNTSETLPDGGGYVTASFSCTDGLGYLKSINFIDNVQNTFYNGRRTMAWWIRECLKKLPHYSYYFAGQAQTFLTEYGLPYPVSDVHGFDSSYSTLDSCEVPAGTFYGPKPELNYLRRLPTIESSFSSTYEVLVDIMTSLGATLCLTKGSWHVFNRTYGALNSADMDSVAVNTFQVSSEEPFYEVYSYTDGSLLIDLDEIQGRFNTGSNRRGVYPYRGAMMVHANAGSDLVYASGAGYGYGIDFPSESGEPVLDQFIFSRFETSLWGLIDDAFPNNTDSEEYQMHNVGIGANEASVTELNIPSGDDGQITFACAGYLNFDANASTWTSAASRFGVGACPIVRFVIRAVSDQGVNYRLRRNVQTLDSFKVSINVSDGMQSLGFGLSNNQNEYHPKSYENNGAYQWVAETDPDYGDAYFETMIGMDPNALEEGATERFLEIDYPGTKFYTPLKTEVKESDEDDDNVLSVRMNQDRCVFIFRIESSFNMPVLASGFVEELHIDEHRLLVYGPETGPRPYGDGTYTFTQNPSWSSSDSTGGNASNSDDKYKPREYALYGLSLKSGDGTAKSDLQYISFDDSNNGSEVKDLGDTRIGSSYVNRSTSVNGRIWAYLFDNGIQLTSSEDNLKWVTKSDELIERDSLLYLNCEDYMNVRYRTRQQVSGTIYRGNTSSYNDVIRPINILKTSNISSATEYLLPASVSYTLSEYSLECLVVGYDRDANLTEDEVTGATRFGGSGGSGPGITDGSDDGISATSTLRNRIAATEAVTDLVQVTSPFTDADLGGSGDSSGSDILSLFMSR